MPPLLAPRRTDPQIALQATVARSASVARAQPAALPRFTSGMAAVGGALAAALTGWVLVAGLAVLGWLAASTGTVSDALGVGTQLWLLANGAGARLGSTAVTLVPWGVTLVFALVLSRFAGFAARQGRGDAPATVLGVTAAMTTAYATPVLAASVLVNGPAHLLRSLLVVVAVAALSSAWGSSRALGHDLTRRWRPWCRSIPRAVLAAQLSMLLAGAAALTTSLVLHWGRVSALSTGLHAGVGGGIVLWLAQLAFWPDAVVWAGSYALGAGFSLGGGSVVAPAGTQLGLLPSVPMLGALPGTGPGGDHAYWWLLSGVLAGAVAAWVVVRARPAARLDETGLVGGLAGLLAGLAFVALAWACGGDLGGERLAGLGPRLLPLLLMACTTMGLSGMLLGLVVGLLRRRRVR